MRAQAKRIAGPLVGPGRTRNHRPDLGSKSESRRSASVLLLDHLFDDEPREFDHQLAQFGILIPQRADLGVLVDECACRQQIAGVLIGKARLRMYMSHYNRSRSFVTQRHRFYMIRLDHRGSMARRGRR